MIEITKFDGRTQEIICFNRTIAFNYIYLMFEFEVEAVPTDDPKL